MLKLLDESGNEVMSSNTYKNIAKYLHMGEITAKTKVQLGQFVNLYDDKIYSIIDTKYESTIKPEIERVIKYLTNSEYNYKTITDVNENLLKSELLKVGIKADITKSKEAICYLVERTNI